MDVAVLGGGNGCFAAAADLAEQGHAVRVWRRDPAAVSALAEAGTIELTDLRGTREVAPALFTSDLEAAVAGAELVLIPLPATAQEALGRRLAGLLADRQVVFLPPGSFGSYAMAAAQHAAGNRAEVTYAEAGTLPYLTRKHGVRAVTITVRATRLPTGVFPARATDHALAVIGAAYPAVERLSDALDGALMNAGPIIHPPLILMNAGPLEHFEHWDIHNEGTQPSIRRVTNALDGERIAVREAAGYGAPHFPLADHYDDSREEWMYGNAWHERLTDSGDWREHIDLTSHRYMREDVAIGLAFLVSVATWAGVEVPVASGLLALGSAVVGEDLRRCGRTLDSLGLARMSRAELRERLERGFAA